MDEALRKQTLALIHEGHQGIVKCRQKAKLCVWWPLMSQQIEILCKDCTTCAREAVLTKEPLITPNRPRRPWQKVGSDLFDFNTRKYIVVVDFYSRWIHCSQIPSSTAKTVVNYLSSLNEKYGYFDEIMTDNGPCYAGDIFRDFCKSIGASHITSSPRYP